MGSPRSEGQHGLVLGRALSLIVVSHIGREKDASGLFLLIRILSSWGLHSGNII